MEPPAVSRARPGLPRGGRRAPKLAERVAEQIVAEIIARGWPTGENIGTESDLLRRYGISRATCRQAIRQVERHGAASMRRGIGGGLIVAERPRSAGMRAIRTYFELTHVSFADQHEAREELEVLAARLASERITPEQLERLKAIVAALEVEADVGASAELGRQFRSGLAAASGNPALRLFVDVLDDTMLQALTLTQVDSAAYARERQQSIRFKRRMLDAVARGDAPAAADLAKEDSKRRLLALASALLQPPPPGRPATAAFQGALGLEGAPRRVADQIMGNIVDGIAQANWTAGHALGREADLMARFGVGRGALREAVRELELHGIVRMETGTRGGLFVGQVDPDYTADVVTTYLRSTEMNASHLWEILRSLEISSAGRLARDVGPDDAAALVAAFERMKAAAVDDYYATSLRLHAEIGDRTGNRVVALFIRIFTRLSGDLVGPATAERLVEWIPQQESIIQAILARDFERAERDMASLFDEAEESRSGRPVPAASLLI